MKNKSNHGGAREGAGRKPGKKAYKTTFPKPTKVMRVPKELVAVVKEMIELYYEKKKVKE